jgi:NAD(P)-dependent dehydrogenase (short-subunit alcohol dehydrogenase family)
MSLFDLSGKVAIVTGGTKGIGLGVAQQMAAQGAKVIVSSREQALCDKVAADLNAAYGAGQTIAKGIAADLNKVDDLEQLARDSAEAFGGLDILVCNAAILPYIGESADTPPELFDRILTVNTHHNFRLCQAARPFLKARGGGAIVFIGSIAGHTAAPSTMAYSIAKAGVAHMARCLADEFAADRIRVNCVAPGFIRSFSSQAVIDNPGAAEAIAGGTPLGRIGEPEDIAGAAIFFASDAGSYVTGQSILVDGGRGVLSPVTAPKGVPGLQSGTTYN